MCDLLILGGVGILSTAAWTVTTVTADDGASWHGSKHARPGHGGLEYHMRHGGGHFATAGQLGMFFPTPPEPVTWESEPGPAPGIPTGGLVVSRPEHMIAGHLVGPSHPPAHTRHGAGRAVGGCDSAADSSQCRRIGPGGRGDGDDAAESHRQPIVAASPGAAGPGRPVSGRSSPGLPGPGRPASPRW